MSQPTTHEVYTGRVSIVTTEDTLGLTTLAMPSGDLMVIAESESEAVVVTTTEGGIGPIGPRGPAGVDGRPVVLSYRQDIPQDIWLIPWGLAYRPIVTVYDSTDALVDVEIDYRTTGFVTVRAEYPFAGRAELV